MIHRRLPGKVLIARQRIDFRVTELAAELEARVENDPDAAFIYVAEGAFFFFSMVMAAMEESTQEIGSIRAESYGNSMTSSGHVKITREPKIDLTGRTVYVFEDVLDKGHTLKRIVEYMRDERGAAQVVPVVLLDKKEARAVNIGVDYIFGFVIPNEFVIGCGMDFAEKHRLLRDIRYLPPLAAIEAQNNRLGAEKCLVLDPKLVGPEDLVAVMALAEGHKAMVRNGTDGRTPYFLVTQDPAADQLVVNEAQLSEILEAAT